MITYTVKFLKDNYPQMNIWVSYRVSGSEGKSGVLFDEHGAALNIYPVGSIHRVWHIYVNKK